jgi:two-component system, NarL family, nitrate/nitrite sensor histidine kinase NarX
MKLTSILSKTGLIFLAFAALVVISVGATYRGVHSQRDDAMVINQAGRQRMLVHYMVRLVSEYEQSGDPALLFSLEEAIDKFEKTLHALYAESRPQNFTGRNLELPAASNPEIIAALETVHITWMLFKDRLIEVKTSQPGDARLLATISSLQDLSNQLIEHSERVVLLYEADSIAKVNRLFIVQFAFMIGAILLLMFSGRLVYRTLILPLRELDSAAGRIGKGDLFTPVRVTGPAEVDLLSETLELMRVQLLDSQTQLQAWGKTLEEKVAHRTQELEALSTVSREISSRLDISSVLQSITDKTSELISSEAAFLCLLDNKGDSLKLHASSGPGEAVSSLSSQIMDQSITQLLAGEKAVPCPAGGCRRLCGIVSQPYQVSHVAAPLRVEDRVIGALCVGSSKPGAFSEESARLLMKLAYAAAVALENARLFERAERTAALEERQRIAADMHDGLAQTISTLQMMVDLAKTQLEKGSIGKAGQTLKKGRAAIDQASTDIRYALASLQEDLPIHSTLQGQLTDLAAEFSRQGLNMQWEDKTTSPIVLPQSINEQLLRITREALLNAAGHSRSENILLRLEICADSGKIIVKDNGQGFDLQEAFSGGEKNPKPGMHFGLKIMQARAARLGGCLEIESVKGIGTCVTLVWPLSGMEQVSQNNGKKVEGN